MGLGTLANPNGLPYSQDAKVVTVLEKLSSHALDATMNTSPSFNEFRNEIRANRPVVSFIPGHSRTVAGYFRQNLVVWGQIPFLTYDRSPDRLAWAVPATDPAPQGGGTIYVAGELAYRSAPGSRLGEDVTGG